MKMLMYEEDSNILKKAVMLLLGAVVGLIYVIFLPFVSVATMIVMACGKALGKLWNLAMDTVHFGWRPSETYLLGKKEKEKEKNNS
jgi:hypothetical protein